MSPTEIHVTQHIQDGHTAHSGTGLPWNITLVRHGQTDANSLNLIHGHTNTPLNENGKSQAASLAEHLKGQVFTKAYASDLSRAHNTAAAVLSANPNNSRLINDSRLREQFYGEYENRTYQEWFDSYGPWAATMECRAKGGENLDDVVLRVTPFFDDLCETMANSFRDELCEPEERNVLVVCHEHTIYAWFRMFSHLFGKHELSSYDIGNTSRTVFRMKGVRKGGMTMRMETRNCTEHLKKKSID